MAGARSHPRVSTPPDRVLFHRPTESPRGSANRPRRFPFRWRERTQRAVAARRIFAYLALMTFLIGLGSGFLVTLLDHKDFPTFGTGVWWAIVTLATVGYGDVVPHTAWGRVLASLVIVNGVTFIALLTATITSYFVSAERDEATAQEAALPDAELARPGEELQQIEQRLVAELARATEPLPRIEQRLAEIEARLRD